MYLTENSHARSEHLYSQLVDFVDQGFLTYSLESIPRGQTKVYYDCMSQHYHKHNWMMFFDMDEYLVLTGRCAAAAPPHIPAPQIPSNFWCKRPRYGTNQQRLMRHAAAPRAERALGLVCCGNPQHTAAVASAFTPRMRRRGQQEAEPSSGLQGSVDVRGNGIVCRRSGYMSLSTRPPRLPGTPHTSARGSHAAMRWCSPSRSPRTVNVGRPTAQRGVKQATVGVV